MAQHIQAGLSVSDEYANFVVLNHSDFKVEVLYLEEFKRPEDIKSELWFLKPIDLIHQTALSRTKDISIALDKKNLLIHTFPMDTSLNKEQQIEHLKWELSQLIPNFHSQEYISDTHIISSKPNEPKLEILSVTINRSMVIDINKFIVNNNMKLNVIDAVHFAAENALLQNHPEIRNQYCILLGLAKSQIEFSLYLNGNLTEYMYRLETNIEFIIQYLQYLMGGKDINSIYLYGPNASEETLKILRAEISPSVNILNPFRRISTALGVRNFDKYSNSTQRFAAAVGIALRKL